MKMLPGMRIVLPSAAVSRERWSLLTEAQQMIELEIMHASLRQLWIYGQTFAVLVLTQAIAMVGRAAIQPPGF